MPDGRFWLKNEINRKLVLIEILTSDKKALELISELLDTDLPNLYKEYEKDNN